ncbi:MAG: O-antigen ligase family protein [Gemmatimonadaceae bacterium]
MEVRTLTRVSAAVNWRLAILLFVLASLLVPLIVPSGFFFPYVFPRNIFFRVVIEAGTLALALAVCFGDSELDLRYEPIFWAIALFVATAFVSALFSPARDHSLYGDFERMGGVWAWLHLALFFLVLRTLRDKDWPWVMNSALIVSLIVSALTILEHSRLASSALASNSMLAASSGTVGNSGLLAAYLLFAIGIAAYLASTGPRLRFLYFAAAGIDLVAMAYAENRSTLIGLVAGTIVGSLIFGAIQTKRRKWLVPAAAVGFACLVAGAAAMIRAFPAGPVARNAPTVIQRLALTNPAGSDESRTMQWRAAIDGFKDRPILGYGLENHNLVWSAHLDPGIYRLDTDIYDRAHNQFLEILATTGIVGAFAFLGIWLAIGVTLFRAYRDGDVSPGSLAVLGGIQIAYAVYLCFWFVDLNSTMLWILVAALIAFRENPYGVLRPASAPFHRQRAPFVVAFASVVLVAGAIYSEAYLPLKANRDLARIDSFRPTLAEATKDFDQLARAPSHLTAHTPLIMAEYLDWVRPDFPSLRRSANDRRMLEKAFAITLDAFRKEIHRDTLNDRLYTHEASTFLDAEEFYDSHDYADHAIDALQRAISLSPRRIQPRMLLATVYEDDHEFESARAVLDDALRVDPELGEPRYRLAQDDFRRGKTDSAFVMLRSSLGHGYVGTPEIYLAIGKHLEFSGHPSDAARLYSSYLEVKYTKAVWNGAGTIDSAVPKADIAVAAHLPLLYVRAQESELAIKTAAALAAFDSSRTDLVERFVSDVGSRRRSRWVAKNSLLPCAPVRSSRSTDAAKLDPCGFFRRKL